ncbi:MAG: NADH-quinone oxidoreductase subunit A [Verrucomicrobiales bacterium]|nr:NADH-quinone oxidoreductase subunit A [Verrucomicrobiales bacterium]
MLGAFAVIVTVGMLLLSVVLGRRGRNSRMKNIAYECGMIPIGPSNVRLSVKFYLVAMLFILFDIEVVFLYPWAVIYRELLAEPAMKNVALISMVSFLGILFAGYLYAVKKGAFDWKD